VECVTSFLDSSLDGGEGLVPEGVVGPEVGREQAGAVARVDWGGGGGFAEAVAGVEVWGELGEGDWDVEGVEGGVEGLEEGGGCRGSGVGDELEGGEREGGVCERVWMVMSVDLVIQGQL
jgi:hypothetical protein